MLQAKVHIRPFLRLFNSNFSDRSEQTRTKGISSICPLLLWIMNSGPYFEVVPAPQDSNGSNNRVCNIDPLPRLSRVSATFSLMGYNFASHAGT